MILWALAAFPLLAAVLCLLIRRRSFLFAWIIAGAGVESAMAACALARVYRTGGVETFFGHLALDGLSAFHLAVVCGIFFLASLYSRDYFAHGHNGQSLDDQKAWKFGVLWFSFLGSMVGVLIFSNVGLMWIAMESTTLASTFLVCLYSDRLSVEAAWKYLMICSAGIVLGLLGTVFIYGAAVSAGPAGEGALKWKVLLERAAQMDPRLVKIGFILILVGYGTKAGLAPMHTWLPDAHSQAPTPVSAVFSGILLNCAMYCITRFIPIVAASTGDPEWPRRLMIGFGLLSMGVAAIFILIQRDLKRFLAYSSVEHMGIISVGMGLGPAGCFAALYHTLNHSICKPLAFFCAGRMVQDHGTRDMDRIAGGIARSPVCGTGLLVSVLVLIGCAPFSIFMSEFLIVRSGVACGRLAVAAIFLLAAAAVFAGALKHVIHMAYGETPEESGGAKSKEGWIGVALVSAMTLALILLGVWIPSTVRAVIHDAARIIGG